MSLSNNVMIIISNVYFLIPKNSHGSVHGLGQRRTHYVNEKRDALLHVGGATTFTLLTPNSLKKNIYIYI